MELTFHPHAVERMSLRNISVDEIIKIIETPNGKIKQSHDKWIYYKTLQKRNDNDVAAVGVSRTASRLEIITVMTRFEVKI